MRSSSYKFASGNGNERQLISKLKYTIEKGCREVAFFSFKRTGCSPVRIYEEPHSLVCSTTYEDEMHITPIAMSEPFTYICMLFKFTPHDKKILYSLRYDSYIRLVYAHFM